MVKPQPEPVPGGRAHGAGAQRVRLATVHRRGPAGGCQGSSATGGSNGGDKLLCLGNGIFQVLCLPVAFPLLL